MAVYPEDPKPIYPLIVSPQWDTLMAGKTDSGKEQRRQKSLFPVFDLTIKYHALGATDTSTLYDFYQATGQGAYGEFYTFDPSLHTSIALLHTSMYIGAGDGSTVLFTVPGRSTTSLSIYVDGVLQTVATNYTVSTGTGEGSADQVTFVTAPQTGAVIYCSFYGYPRYKTRFLHDSMPFELFVRSLYQFGVQLKGLAGA